jgi:hypothetical protein
MRQPGTIPVAAGAAHPTRLPCVYVASVATVPLLCDARGRNAGRPRSHWTRRAVLRTVLAMSPKSREGTDPLAASSAWSCELGPLLTRDELAGYLAVGSTGDIDELVRQRRLIVLPGRDAAWRCPAFQFHDGRLLDELVAAFRVLPGPARASGRPPPGAWRPMRSSTVSRRYFGPRGVVIRGSSRGSRGRTPRASRGSGRVTRLAA